MDKVVKICPICHKAFTNRDGCKINPTCSVQCGTLFAQHDRHARERLVEIAAELRRQPRTDCRAYMAGGKCSALNALWCRYENCKFYKKREDDNG